jgi:hypothetical protein
MRGDSGDCYRVRNDWGTPTVGLSKRFHGYQVEEGAPGVGIQPTNGTVALPCVALSLFFF